MAKILIVEDDAPIRQLYVTKLSSAGYQIAEATDGVEGLEQAEKFKPDLILLDLRMPVMTGQEMLQKLRATDWGKHMLVIVLTNVSQSEASMDLKLLRVEKYIVKAHYTPKQVLDVVTETLTRYKKL
jgi:CheY-like chemotaxis protein